MIYYLVPSSEKPSWGLAILYNHVRMLVTSGKKACIVKEGPQRCPSWLDIKVPYETTGNFKKEAAPKDTVIVPEVMVNFEGLKKIKSRKILFVQAGGFLFQAMPAGESHISLGFEHVWIIMKHLESIVGKHVQLPYSIIPPFVAPYFFNDALSGERKKQILMFPKFEQLDYSIVKYIIKEHIKKGKQPYLKNLFSNNNWQIKVLQGLSHTEVAAQMKSAAFFISLNLFEALNTSVVEAMAAGCVVFCYEGFGPRDYLENGKNAMVFPNNEAYKLAETVCNWIDNYVESSMAVNELRVYAAATAKQFTEQNTEDSLMKFFGSHP